jgi:hypothetical protein
MSQNYPMGQNQQSSGTHVVPYYQENPGIYGHNNPNQVVNPPYKKTVFEVLKDYSSLSTSDQRLFITNQWLLNNGLFAESLSGIGFKIIKADATTEDIQSGELPEEEIPQPVTRNRSPNVIVTGYINKSPKGWNVQSGVSSDIPLRELGPSFVRDITIKKEFERVMNPSVTGKLPVTPVYINKNTGDYYIIEGRRIKTAPNGNLLTERVKSSGGGYVWIYLLAGLTKGERQEFTNWQKERAKRGSSKKGKKIPQGHLAEDPQFKGSSLPPKEILENKSNQDVKPKTGVPEWNKYLVEYDDKIKLYDIPDENVQEVMENWVLFVQTKFELDQHLERNSLFKHYTVHNLPGVPDCIIVDLFGHEIIEPSLTKLMDARKIASINWCKTRNKVLKRIGLSQTNRRFAQFNGTYKYLSKPNTIYNGPKVKLSVETQSLIDKCYAKAQHDYKTGNQTNLPENMELYNNNIFFSGQLYSDGILEKGFTTTSNNNNNDSEFIPELTPSEEEVISSNIVTKR